MKATAQFTLKVLLPYPMFPANADLKFIEDKGMTINTVEQKPFVEAAKPVYDKYGVKFGDLIDRIRNTK